MTFDHAFLAVCLTVLVVINMSTDEVILRLVTIGTIGLATYTLGAMNVYYDNKRK